MITEILCQLELRDWLSYRGQQNTLATCNYHVVMGVFFVCFFFRIHVYVTREVYLGKSGRHTNTISRGKRVIYHGKSVPCCHTSNLLLQSLSYAKMDYAVLSVSVHLNSLLALQGTYQVLCD